MRIGGRNFGTYKLTQPHYTAKRAYRQGYGPEHCFFCGNRAKQQIERVVPSADGKQQMKRLLPYCGSC